MKKINKMQRDAYVNKHRDREARYSRKKSAVCVARSASNRGQTRSWCELSCRGASDASSAIGCLHLLTISARSWRTKRRGLADLLTINRSLFTQVLFQIFPFLSATTTSRLTQRAPSPDLTFIATICVQTRNNVSADEVIEVTRYIHILYL